MSPVPRPLRSAASVVTPPPWLRGATVLLTGASSGIGAALAREAAATAGVVVLVARRQDRLEALAGELAGVARGDLPDLVVDVRPTDLSSSEAVQELAAAVVESHGGVDVLVNNAGFGDYSLLAAADPDTLSRMIAVNVAAPTLLTRALLPGMVAKGHGAVLMVGSSAGQMPTPGAAVYGASKFYVHGLSEAVRAEVAGTGVQVTEVAPGPVATEFDEVSGMEPLTGALDVVRISAAQCAAEAWEGMSHGRPIVYPGTAMRWAMRANAVVPTAALRPVLGHLGRRTRENGHP